VPVGWSDDLEPAEVLRLIRDHWAVILSLAGFSFVILKLAAVSRFSFTTAVALVSSSNLVSLLTGTLLLAIRDVIFYTGLILLLSFVADAAISWLTDKGRPSPSTLLAGVPLTTIGILLQQPWWAGLKTVARVVLANLAVLMAQLLQFLWPLWERRRLRELHRTIEDVVRAELERRMNESENGQDEKELEKRVRADVFRRYVESGDITLEQLAGLAGPARHEGGITFEKYDASDVTSYVEAIAWWNGWALIIIPAVMFVYFVALSDIVWVPAEVIKIHPRHRVVGYVVGTDAQWMTILTDRDRRIMRVKADQVVGRRICELVKQARSPLQNWMGAVPNPRCPQRRGSVNNA
jgi:hypothetical protein